MEIPADFSQDVNPRGDRLSRAGGGSGRCSAAAHPQTLERTGRPGMLKRVAELLARCGSSASVLPPTELYNEGWLLRLVLDWFDRNRTLSHQLSFLPGARWYSEALLPSRFLPQRRSDERAESFTHADGVVGHFSIAPGERGEARLLPQPRQFVVAEAKLGSALSAGTKHAPEYDQAARNVACMAHMLEGVDLTTIEHLGFYVIAPDHQIRAGSSATWSPKKASIGRLQCGWPSTKAIGTHGSGARSSRCSSALISRFCRGNQPLAPCRPTRNL